MEVSNTCRPVLSMLVDVYVWLDMHDVFWGIRRSMIFLAKHVDSSQADIFSVFDAL